MFTDGQLRTLGSWATVIEQYVPIERIEIRTEPDNADLTLETWGRGGGHAEIRVVPDGAAFSTTTGLPVKVPR